MLDHFDSNLTTAIRSNKLILFCGAGVSCSSGLPTWKDLTTSVLKVLANDFPELRPFIDLLATNTLTSIDVLSFVQKHKNRVWDHIIPILKVDNNSNLTLQKNLLSLSKKVITTNYDKAFEYASNHSINVILPNNNYKLAKLNNTHEYIFKIHGDIDNPENCILFKEDYEKLYPEDGTSYLLELKKIVTDNTILFVGFSLSDPFIERIFHSVNQMYNHFNNEHYIITTDTKFPKDRFSHKIHPINIQSHEELNFKINELRSLISLKTSTNNVPIKKDDTKKNKPKIQSKAPLVTILKAKPIDKDFILKEDLLIESIAKYAIEIERDFLNFSTLQNIEETQYLFLFTKCFKGHFLIEDEYLKSEKVGLTEIDENIPSNKLKGIIIFYEGDHYKNSNDHYTRSYFLYNISGLKHKDFFNKFTYQFFTKKIVPNTNQFLFVGQYDKIIFPDFPKGICIRKFYFPLISKHLDSKILNRFVGRKNDLENIIRNLVDLKYESKILTIKGAGGIGKTTLITKAVIELAERKFYPNGVFFIQCQSISSLENFKFEISQCFELDTSIELEKQIRDNFKEKNRIIILDNFETQLYSLQKNEILDFVSFISDYSIIVTTSRQKLDLEFEELYDLRNLTTDEGLELFLSLHDGTFSENEILLLRYELVERILNNNPLAIKLIAKGTPPDKDIHLLISELDEDIFKNENINIIFERPEDINIERTQSLYQSINYSYQLLSEKERFAFEILSIFPDGLRLEHFKKFSKASPKIKYKIEDKDIKSLDDKSLLERRNNLLRLQSIVSRFAENKFKNRDESIRLDLYTNAFNFNMSLLSTLKDIRKIKRGKSVRLFDMHYNNFLKTLESLPIINVDKIDKLVFISLVSDLFRMTNQEEQFIKTLKSIRNHFVDISHGTDLIDCTKVTTLYYVKNFDEPFHELLNFMPFERLPLLDQKETLQEHVFHKASALYECEGYTYELLQMEEAESNNFNNLIFKLYKLGYIDKANKIVEETLTEEDFDFVILEIKNTLNQIDADYIHKNIKSIYSKEILEIVQCTYVLSKRVDIPYEDIKKLVISNPYTKGLIKLMTIPHLLNEEEIKSTYVEAIKALEHIKYYYLEAIISYCNYLKSIKSKDFENWHKIGYTAAQKYKYSYQIFMFEKMRSNDIHFPYDEIRYTNMYAPLSADVENMIKRSVSKQKKRNYYSSR